MKDLLTWYEPLLFMYLLLYVQYKFFCWHVLTSVHYLFEWRVNILHTMPYFMCILILHLVIKTVYSVAFQLHFVAMQCVSVGGEVGGVDQHEIEKLFGCLPFFFFFFVVVVGLLVLFMVHINLVLLLVFVKHKKN